MNRLLFCLLPAAACLVGCGRGTSTVTDRAVAVRFTRCGAVADGGSRAIESVAVAKAGVPVQAAAQRLGAGRILLSFDWQPKEEFRFTVEGKDVGRVDIPAIAPVNPAAETIATVPLENIIAEGGSMGGAADTEVRFSPDGKTLAIGSFLGYLRLVDVPTGKILHEQKLAEGLIKQLVFSRDGKTLFIGEQSPDAFVYAMDLGTRRVKWRFRLADDLETSARKRDDRFGIFWLPGAYRLMEVADGDLLVTGIHSWTKDIGGKPTRVNRSRLYRLDPRTGQPGWRFPKEKPLPVNIIWFDASSDGKHIVVAVESSSEENVSSPITPGAVYFLDGTTGELIGRFAPAPLRPHFEQVLIWRSAAISADGRLAGFGCLDGRAFLFDFPKAAKDVKPRWRKDLGTPIVVSGVPLSAPVSYSFVKTDRVYFVVTGTVIPQGARSAAQRVPSPHPNTNSLFALDFAGDLKWKWHTAGAAQALACSADGRYLMITTGENWLTHATDTFGFALFDTRRPGSGIDRLIYEYRTEGPVFPECDISRDGRFIAITEVPKALSDKTTVGTYKVHIVQ